MSELPWCVTQTQQVGACPFPSKLEVLVRYYIFKTSVP